MDRVDSALPPIPAKRYFTIGEVSELCLVKPYVLRYWEQEFVQLKPMKRRGNRRYYQHHEVLLIRRIRELLYEQGFTISGARNQLAEGGSHAPLPEPEVDEFDLGMGATMSGAGVPAGAWQSSAGSTAASSRPLQSNSPASIGAAWGAPNLDAMQALDPQTVMALREALVSIRELLS